MFRHILLPIEFSGASRRALDVAVDLTRAHGARLTVLHVYEASSPTLAYAAATRADKLTWPGAVRARAELDPVVARLRARGVRAEGVLRFGLVRDQVFEAARERGVDLIVTSTRGRSGLARVWYGSVSEQIARGSTVPVLVVPRASDNVVRFRRA